MQELFASGAIVDLIIAFMAVEFAALAVYQRSKGGTATFWPLASILLPGLFLLLALRAALTQSPWWTIAAFLLLALAFHLVDLFSRMRALER